MTIMNSIKLSLLLAAFIILGSLLGGCQKISTAEINNTLITTVQSDKLLTPMIGPTKSPKPVLTATIISLPSDRPTEEVSTGIPIPSLSPTEAAGQILDLMKNNASCRFPCWWGITPGKTNWTDAYKLLTPLSSESEYISHLQNEESFNAGLSFFAEEYRIIQEYIVRNGIIDLIEVRFGKFPSSTLSNLIMSYGTPEEVWLSTYNMEAQGSLPFDVLLVYPSKGISAYFHSLDAKVKGDQVQKCFGDETILVLDLWDPNSGESYEQRTKEMPMLEDMTSFDQFQKLETTTNLTPDSFAEDLTGPGHSVCINTPSRFWKSPFQ